MNGVEDSPPSLEINGSSTFMDGKIWEAFQRSFLQVQTILNQNQVLIQEINRNHETKIPQNLTRNVALIRELNSNISRVVELYGNLSTEFVQLMAAEKSRGSDLKVDDNGSNTPLSKGQKRQRPG